MPLPEPTRKQVESILTQFCERRVPEHVRDRVRLTFDMKGNNVTLSEERPLFTNPSQWTKTPIAQFRFDPKSKKWSLYCTDRDERWHEDIDNIPTKDLQELVDLVDEDPTGIYWG